jgi:hypothetical protein
MPHGNPSSVTPVQERVPLFRWDGTVPAWGLFMVCFTLGTGWVTYSWNRIQDLGDRLTLAEASAAEYRKKTDTLETQMRDQGAVLSGMRSDILVVKELMIRLEKRFDK